MKNICEKVPSAKTTHDGKGTITSMVIKTWNDIHKIVTDMLWNYFSHTKLEIFLNRFFSDFYKDPQ